MSVRETQNGTPRGAFFCGFCRSPEGAAAACSGYVDILRGRGLEMPPSPQNSATCYKFLHTWAISDITAWETAPDVLRHESVKWQGVFRAAGEEPSGRPEGMSMRSGTDFRNGDGAP